jgi:hypothetical protein
MEAMTRTHLRGHQSILKRLLLHCGAFNLGQRLRRTPRGLQGRLAPLLARVVALWRRLTSSWRLLMPQGLNNQTVPAQGRTGGYRPSEPAFATDCQGWCLIILARR